MGSLTDDYSGSNPITIGNKQVKEECSYPLTKSASASAPSNFVVAPVAKPRMPVARFNSLGWATKRGGTDKPSCSAPASIQRTLKSAQRLL